MGDSQGTLRGLTRKTSSPTAGKAQAKAVCLHSLPGFPRSPKPSVRRSFSAVDDCRDAKEPWPSPDRDPGAGRLGPSGVRRGASARAGLRGAELGRRRRTARGSDPGPGSNSGRLPVAGDQRRLGAVRWRTVCHADHQHHAGVGRPQHFEPAGGYAWSSLDRHASRHTVAATSGGFLPGPPGPAPARRAHQIAEAGARGRSLRGASAAWSAASGASSRTVNVRIRGFIAVAQLLTIHPRQSTSSLSHLHATRRILSIRDT
jgi:hypothetical protein